MQNCRTEDGVSHTDLIVRHGCFNELGLHEQYEELSCQGSTDDIDKKCSVSQITKNKTGEYCVFIKNMHSQHYLSLPV